LKNKADVIVCDGFVGNIILKLSEGVAEFMISLIKSAIKKHPISWAALPFLWFALKDIKKKVDYVEVGGAPLLGVNGVCIIGHGSSNAKAVKNALLLAQKAVKYNLISEIKTAIKKCNEKVGVNG
jgi:glycerol-3-phosphate acyltransferase PlsX